MADTIRFAVGDYVEATNSVNGSTRRGHVVKVYDKLHDLLHVRFDDGTEETALMTNGVRRVPGGSATAATAEQVTLRDAVESAIRNGIEDWNGETNPERFAADAVLDMAELKAVADVLYRLAEGGRKMDHGRRQLEIWGVPESFIVWMLRETPKGNSDER